MQYSISKHANSLYRVWVGQEGCRADTQLTVFKNIYVYPEYSDIRKEINIMQTLYGFGTTYTFKTDLETLEIILDIFSDHGYYSLTGLKEIIEEIKIHEGE